MTIHRSSTRGALLALALAWVLSPFSSCTEDGTILFDPSSRLQEIDFRDGVSPDSLYSGTRDAFLKEGNPLVNYNFGTNPFDTVGHLFLTDRYFERRQIIRFDITDITDCGDVLTAELRLHFSSMSPDTLTLQAYEASVPEIVGASWLEGTGGLAAGVSWQTVEGAIPWETEGGDPVGLPIETVVTSQDTVASFLLPNSLVLRWIEEPESNHGVVIGALNRGVEEYIILHTRESLEADQRPRLSIEYLRGG
jgi:hypothetical protein